MGKLTDLVSKGVKLIVAETPEADAGVADEATTSPPPPPRRSREISADELEAAPPRSVAQSDVPADVTDFAAVYGEAGIEPPTHGYGIDKVAEMLENKRFASLSREAKATAVLVALEAAGVPMRDVIQDAVARDKALDGFEGSKEREAQQLAAQNSARIQELNKQLEELIGKINSEVESLKRGSEEAARAFEALKVRKRREEERLHHVVAHFIEGPDNPITTASGAPAAAPKPQS